MRAELIPALHKPPGDHYERSQVARLITDPPARRRTVLRIMTAGVLASTLLPFDWLLSRTKAFGAGPTSEFTGANCSPPYSNGYTEQANNWWSSGTARCFGGWRRGSYPCSGGFHFEGFKSYSDEGYTSYRIASSCGNTSNGYRNAWRWSNGAYRCSDAMTTCVWNSGERYTDLTVAMCGV
jgi:hypothetical protein